VDSRDGRDPRAVLRQMAVPPQVLFLYLGLGTVGTVVVGNVAVWALLVVTVIEVFAYVKTAVAEGWQSGLLAETEKTARRSVIGYGAMIVMKKLVWEDAMADLLRAVHNSRLTSTGEWPVVVLFPGYSGALVVSSLEDLPAAAFPPTSMLDQRQRIARSADG